MRELTDYPVEKLATDFNRHFKVEDIRMVNKQTNFFFLTCYVGFSGRNIAKNQIERNCDFEVLVGHLVEIPM